MRGDTATAPASSSALVIRAGTSEDVERSGQIFYDAFEAIAARHNLPVEPSSPQFTHLIAEYMLASEGIEMFVASRGEEIVGSAFVDERSVVAGVGPVTVDPAAQDEGAGRALMQAVLNREREREAAGVRLVQTAYHYRSLALYASLGFVVREPLSVFQGDVPARSLPGLAVRSAEVEDVIQCDELCTRVHGHARDRELRAAIGAGTARVVEGVDGIRGYATGFGYGWHAVADSNEDLVALVCSAEALVELGILVPSRNAELMRWCLASGLRIVQQSTLMTTGLYSEPAGAWLPSIAY
jgi:predicted N-acetyltransferase YhbS